MQKYYLLIKDDTFALRTAAKPATWPGASQVRCGIKRESVAANQLYSAAVDESLCFRARRPRQLSLGELNGESEEESG